MEARQTDIVRVADISISDTRWRGYGEARRMELLEEDVRQGGTVFSLNRRCSVHRYFAVSRRVRLYSVSLVLFVR
jgi:hypothetical protein